MCAGVLTCGYRCPHTTHHTHTHTHSWDEWLLHDRVMKHNDKNLKRQSDLQAAAYVALATAAVNRVPSLVLQKKPSHWLTLNDGRCESCHPSFRGSEQGRGSRQLPGRFYRCRNTVLVCLCNATHCGPENCRKKDRKRLPRSAIDGVGGRMHPRRETEGKPLHCLRRVCGWGGLGRGWVAGGRV